MCKSVSINRAPSSTARRNATIVFSGAWPEAPRCAMTQGCRMSAYPNRITGPEIPLAANVPSSARRVGSPVALASRRLLRAQISTRAVLRDGSPHKINGIALVVRAVGLSAIAGFRGRKRRRDASATKAETWQILSHLGQAATVIRQGQREPTLESEADPGVRRGNTLQRTHYK